MKKLKRILSMLLVVCMIFTSHAFVTFAEGMGNTEAIENETTIEETTVEADDNFVGAKLGEPEEESIVGANFGEPEGADITLQSSTPDDDIEETDYPEEPEEEATVGAKLGELETEVKTESEAETEVEEKLFGDSPIYTLSLKPNFPEGFSLPEGSSWYEDKSGPLYSDTDSILIEGWNTRICVDTAGNVCNLTGYNTKADGSGTRFSYQESISKYNLEYFDLPSDSYDLVLYAMWKTSNLYTLHYNKNLPEGYSLAEGSTWGNDATLWDYADEFVFEIYDYTGMTCEDASGNVRTLEGWNTAAGGTGDDYSFGDWITSESLFTDGELTLYAVWSEPVAPGPTAFAYWIVTGEGDNKTIHYYATAGEGRTAIVLDETTGVVYSGLDKESVKYAIIEDRIEVTDAKSFFSGFYYLETITGLSNLDTSKATSFWSMFLDCESLTGTLDVSTFDTSSLIYMHQMFSSCALLTSINFGDNFDTSNVTNMSSLFYACSSLQTITFGDKFKTNKVTEMGQMFSTCNDLQSLDLTGFDTSVVVDMEGMFGGCMALTSLDLTSFDTSSVTNMRDMFASCLKLKKIYVSDGFTVENVEYSDDMFRDNTQLEGGSGTLYSNVSAPYDKTYAHIDGGTTNPGFFSGASTPTTYTVTYNQNLPSGYSLSDGKTWYPDETFPNAESIYTELNGSDDMTCEDADGITRKLLKWNTKADGTGTEYNFADEIADATHFTEYKLILYAVWSEGPYMYWIVDGDGDNKTIHYYASAGEGRTAVDFDENGVVYTSLSEDERNSIKKAVFEEPIVATDVRRLFKDFKGLVSITNLGNLNTSNATSFKAMFEHCEAIEKIETSGLETDSLTDTSYMFTYCTSATEIILDDNFDTSNVTSMREMFNTTGAKELDLTKFDTSNVTDMYGMFSSCENLETIRVSDKFVVDKVSTSNGKFMFSGCEKLVGEKGTKFTDTETPWGKLYAHIDEGSTNPGLFSGASTPTPTTYTVTYNQNLPSGYTISTSKTWYTDSTSDDLSSNPIKISGSAGMTCENADGYVRKLEAWNTLADKSGTPYMFAENIDSPSAFTSNPLTLYAVWGDPVVPTPGTDKFYIISYGNPTEYPNEKKIFAFDSTTTVEEMENFVANNISKCINPSGKAANGFYDMSELIPAGADDTQVRQILNNNYDLTKEKIRTLDKIAVWFEDYIPDPMGVYLGITFEGSTPTPPTPSPTPRPYVPGGGDSGGSSSGSSDPTHGPMGDLTKNPLYADTLNGTNNIPESKMVSNDTLATTLKSYPENVNSPMVNARDDNGNVGYGQWLRVPNTTTWYFLSGSFNQGTGTTNTGFLANGWFNLGWDGQDKWYYFDGAGVMKIGWHQEGNKIYYLQADFSDNWYGKAMTGQQMIGGQVYNFDSNGALIQ